MYTRIWMVGIMLCMSTAAYAQTLTTDASASQKMWEILLKLLFPAIWTAVGPMLTDFVTKGMQKVPASLHMVISSVIGGVLAGVAGAIPDFPLSIESAATMGIAGGATGSVLLNKQSQQNAS